MTFLAHSKIQLSGFLFFAYQQDDSKTYEEDEETAIVKIILKKKNKAGKLIWRDSRPTVNL